MQRKNECPSAARPTDEADASVRPEESLPVISAASGPTSLFEGAIPTSRSSLEGQPDGGSRVLITCLCKAQEQQGELDRRAAIRVGERAYIRSARNVRIVRVCNRRVGTVIVSIEPMSASDGIEIAGDPCVDRSCGESSR